MSRTPSGNSRSIEMRQRHKRKDGTAYFSEKGEEFGTFEWEGAN
jgi:hypothetical protein